ncbi:MAG TPA: NADH-quinone oxidoreductase subunit N [Gemmatimonadales bacterium]
MLLDLSTVGGIFLALLPEIVLTVWALALMLAIAWKHGQPGYQRQVGLATVSGLVAALIAVLWLWTRQAAPSGLPMMIALDTFRYAIAVVFLLGAIATVLLSLEYLARERIDVPEYYVLILFATIGMMLMGGGADLIVIFLGLELMSVSVYVLAGIRRRSGASAEAALKYFLLGAFASAFLLYGIALVYGATGSTNIVAVAFQIADSGITHSPLLVVGAAMLLIGFGFKVAAVPFHMWAPDAYDGAPTPITAFMAAAVKAAAFAALARVMVLALGGALDVWQDAVWWLAAITMVAGNLMALAQRHLKRMLAYSAIAHAGYLLAAVASGTPVGGAAFLFYAFAYTLMTIGAFAVLISAGRGGESDVRIDQFNGLATERPWLAFAMAVFMLSLLGFPGTAGFIGKWYILTATVDANQVVLAVILVLASVVSAGYYLPVIMNMYMRPVDAERREPEGAYRLPGAARAVVGVAVVLLLLFGVWPNRVLSIVDDGGRDLRPPTIMASTAGPR